MGNGFQASHFPGTSMEAMVWETERGERCHQGRIRRSIGTGPQEHSFFLAFLSRFLKQWVLVWNGYDGRIYISTSPKLADRAFQPARILVEKATDQEKNWWWQSKSDIIVPFLWHYWLNIACLLPLQVSYLDIQGLWRSTWTSTLLSLLETFSTGSTRFEWWFKHCDEEP